MKILARNRQVHYVDYDIVFKSLDGDSEYRFECNEFGEVDINQLSDSEVQLFVMCWEKDVEVHDAVVESRSKAFVARLIGECDHCNALVVVDSSVNVCFGCGAEYDYHGESVEDTAIAG